jgi:hypothetical protein
LDFGGYSSRNRIMQMELIARIGSLVLVRLLATREGSETMAKIKRDVGGTVGDWSQLTWWTRYFDEALARLESEGSVCWVKRGKITRWALTPPGRDRACEFLGIDELSPTTTWASVKKTYLLAKLLNLPAPRTDQLKRLATENGAQAAVLKARFDLKIADYPTLAQATDALAWKLMGFDSGRPFSKEAVLLALFDRRLGSSGLNKSSQALTRLTERSVGATGSNAVQLSEGAVRRWLANQTAPESPTESKASANVEPKAGAQPSPPPSEEEARARALRWFAHHVESAARTCPTGRLGNSQVFIAHVWHRLRKDPDFRGMKLTDFKILLAHAQEKRLIELSRAEVGEAMDPTDIHVSAMRHQDATFHLICF